MRAMTPIERIIERIPQLNDNDLSTVFGNAADMIANSCVPSKVADAEAVFVALSQEWRRRLEAASEGAYTCERPNVGMLATLGYHVGINGVANKKRRTFLDFIMEHHLPFVQSPAYVLEWGEPLTRTRYRKLTQTISHLIDTKTYVDGNEKAVIEWTEDLVYLQEKWLGRVD